jgi:hypothetical protein
MSKMNQLVGEMYARLNQIADSERALVRDLAETIRSVDLQVLQDVRAMAAHRIGEPRRLYRHISHIGQADKNLCRPPGQAACARQRRSGATRARRLAPGR